MPLVAARREIKRATIVEKLESVEARQAIGTRANVRTLTV